MGFIRQTWTLTAKNIRIALYRHWFATLIRAFILPVAFMIFVGELKQFFIPPATYGIGTPLPIRSFENALRAADSSRQTVAFVNNGHTGGNIETIINRLSDTVRSAGRTPVTLQTNQQLLRTCRNSLRGASGCYGAVVFNGAPGEGGAIYNYTLRADGALGVSIFVDQDHNDAEIYVLPFQRAIDQAINEISGNANYPATVNEYPYTTQTQAERTESVRRAYTRAVINILGVIFYLGMVGIVYHLAGTVATERELGMSQLIEVMTPNKHRFITQAARLFAAHFAFDIIYFPGWVIIAVVLKYLTFTQTTSTGLLVGFHILTGLSLASMAIFGAAFFRRAQLSGITVVLVTIILAIIVQVRPPTSTSTVAVLSILFPSVTYTLGIVYFARFERAGLPIDLSATAPQSPWRVNGNAFFVFLAIQIVVFPILGALVERGLYGTTNKARKIVGGEEHSPHAIRLIGFSKHFRPTFWRRIGNILRRKSNASFVAVNNFTLDVLRGQILVLLGANGSGKSTTMDAISGLNKITEGSIELDGTGGLGLCPQKNVMWDELTVFEHVSYFNRLKSQGHVASKAEVLELISACDLGHKVNAQSKTLSGGQKRKLQLAMMFAGGSKVCCIDEVSSGIDPLSRRKIWDILLRERGSRTMLLTSHFLDEADVLSDHIAMLSKGNLKAEGSAVELKHRFADGYEIRVNSLPVDTKSVQVGTYRMRDSAQASSFMTGLERSGVEDYTVTGPTIEQVFMRLADEVKSNDDHTATKSDTDSSRSIEAPSGIAMTTVQPTKMEAAAGAVTYSPETGRHNDKNLNLGTGHGIGILRQSWVLFIKRFTVLKRNYIPYVCAVLIPIITAGLVTRFLKDFTQTTCNPTQNSASIQAVRDLADQAVLRIPVGPPSRVNLNTLALYARLFGQNASIFQTVNSLPEFNRFIAMNYANTTPGGFYLGDTAADTPTIAYIGNFVLAWSALTQTLFSNLAGTVPIFAQFQSFATPFTPDIGNTLQLLFYFGLAMCVYPAFFALYPTIERLRQVRALHWSNGIQAAPLWIAYLAFDFVFVLIISVVCVALWTGLSGIFYYPGYLFTVFFLYGITSALFVYVVSLFVGSQLAAFAFAAGVQAVCFLIYFIAFLGLLSYSPANRVDGDLLIANYTISLITPAGNLLRALLLTLNTFGALCNDQTLRPYGGDIKAFGGPILYLILQAMLLLGYLVWREGGYTFAAFRKKNGTAADMESKTTSKTLAPDVLAEVETTDSVAAGLRVQHVSKTFGKLQAVDDVTFSVQHSSVFALLGPNGAGKSTTISLIRGDLKPDHHGGDVLVEDHSIIRNKAEARKHLGVCPQFDAMDNMTVQEHLVFYAKARGVKDVKTNVDRVIDAVGLPVYRHRVAHKLSGGNKRKLSLGIALIGNPSVILLDEPSSGMDAAAKRVMWRTLEGVSADRGILITTHSMEEADYLADRAGIMATRMLALDTVSGLRERFGGTWYVHVVLKGAPHVSENDCARAQSWLQRNVPGATIERQAWGGQVRFQVPAATDGQERLGVARLFRLLEENRDELGLEYYSMSQATLDQVFLEVVGRNNVKEEGHADEGEVGKGSGLVRRLFRRK